MKCYTIAPQCRHKEDHMEPAAGIASVATAQVAEPLLPDHPKIKRTHFLVTDSTQTQAKEHIEKVEPDSWFVYTASEQTKGRGQHDRKWASPPGVNVYATYLFPIPSDQSYLLFHLPQVTTVAVAKTIEEFGFRPQIKWINDLMLDYKKMCGILCESFDLVKTQEYKAVLCGIGVNVNMAKEICDGLDQPVTSLFVEKGKKFDKELVLQRLSHHLYMHVNQLMAHGFSGFHHELNQRLAFIGQKIKIERSNPTEFVEGVFERIDESGCMVLQLETGEHRTLFDGRIVR